MDLWTCPGCGRGFANRNQSHACAPLRGLDELFAGSGPQVRAIFDQVLAAAQVLGPVRVLPEQTRIARGALNLPLPGPGRRHGTVRQ